MRNTAFADSTGIPRVIMSSIACVPMSIKYRLASFPSPTVIIAHEQRRLGSGTPWLVPKNVILMAFPFDKSKVFTVSIIP